MSSQCLSFFHMFSSFSFWITAASLQKNWAGLEIIQVLQSSKLSSPNNYLRHQKLPCVMFEDMVKTKANKKNALGNPYSAIRSMYILLISVILSFLISKISSFPINHHKLALNDFPRFFSSFTFANPILTWLSVLLRWLLYT